MIQTLTYLILVAVSLATDDVMTTSTEPKIAETRSEEGTLSR